jgi:hypothetical protein
MDLKKLSKGLYLAGIAAIILVGIIGVIGISRGGSSDDFFWFLMPGVALELIGMFVGSLARKQERERVARELERKRQSR